jgi:acyl carrier protein
MTNSSLANGTAHASGVDTLNRLLAILKKEYKTDTSQFSGETTLADTGLDSLSLTDLLFEIEDVFEIKLDDLSPDQMPQQLSGLVDLIDRQIAAKPAQAT